MVTVFRLYRAYVVPYNVWVMERRFKQQLQRCQPELQPAFRELRELFWPLGQYREAPTTGS